MSQAKAAYEASHAAGQLMLPKDVNLVVSSFEPGGQTSFVFPDGSTLECLGLKFGRVYWSEAGDMPYQLTLAKES